MQQKRKAHRRLVKTMNDKFKIGDLVKINNERSEWEYLNEKSENHPLRKQGVVLEVTEINYVIRFGNFTAFLKEKDLVKLSEG